jgi:hypothetical protein
MRAWLHHRSPPPTRAYFSWILEDMKRSVCCSKGGQVKGQNLGQIVSRNVPGGFEREFKDLGSLSWQPCLARATDRPTYSSLTQSWHTKPRKLSRASFSLTLMQSLLRLYSYSSSSPHATHVVWQQAAAACGEIGSISTTAKLIGKAAPRHTRCENS